jgi:hypothetical protein
MVYLCQPKICPVACAPLKGELLPESSLAAGALNAISKSDKEKSMLAKD